MAEIGRLSGFGLQLTKIRSSSPKRTTTQLKLVHLLNELQFHPFSSLGSTMDDFEAMLSSFESNRNITAQRCWDLARKRILLLVKASMQSEFVRESQR